MWIFPRASSLEIYQNLGCSPSGWCNINAVYSDIYSSVTDHGSACSRASEIWNKLKCLIKMTK